VCSDYVHAIITLRYVVSEVLPGFAWKRFGVGLLVGAKGWKSIKFLRFMRTPLLISPSWYGLNFATVFYISDCKATYTVTINNRPEDRLIKGFYASHSSEITAL
jgi:hypothetical protein